MTVWLRTGEVFELMAGDALARDQALVLLRALARESSWDQGILRPMYQRARRGERRDLVELLEHTQEDILALPKAEQVQVMLHLRELTGAIGAHHSLHPHSALSDQAARLNLSALTLQQHELQVALEKHTTEDEIAPQPKVADFVDDFLREKCRAGDDGKAGYTPGTVQQARTTFRLWRELMGDIPVKAVTGLEAGLFRERLLTMPANHGKAVGRGGRAPKVAALDAIEAAKAAAETSGVALKSIRMKTARRHFSFMSQLWKYLHRREHVDGQVFAGFEFPGTKAKRSNRDAWSTPDLVRLLRSDHMQAAARTRGRDYWVVAIAMFSGMRLEEVCRLRWVASAFVVEIRC